MTLTQEDKFELEQLAINGSHGPVLRLVEQLSQDLEQEVLKKDLTRVEDERAFIVLKYRAEGARKLLFSLRQYFKALVK